MTLDIRFSLFNQRETEQYLEYCKNQPLWKSEMQQECHLEYLNVVLNYWEYTVFLPHKDSTRFFFLKSFFLIHSVDTCHSMDIYEK